MPFSVHCFGKNGMTNVKYEAAFVTLYLCTPETKKWAVVQAKRKKILVSFLPIIQYKIGRKQRYFVNSSISQLCRHVLFCHYKFLSVNFFTSHG